VFTSLEDALGAFAPDMLADSDEPQEIGTKNLLEAESRRAFARSAVALDIEARLTVRGVVAKYFRTDTAHVFAVSFTAFFHVNKDIEDRLHGEATVSGECTLDTRQTTLDSVTLNSIDWRLRDQDGKVMRVPEILAEAP
jgi:hypothetical protein